MIRQNHANAIRPTRALAVLAICASLLLSAIAFSVATQVVRDPENPAYVGNTIGSSTTVGSQTVRDQENPYWTGAAANSAVGGGAQTQGLK